LTDENKELVRDNGCMSCPFYGHGLSIGGRIFYKTNDDRCALVKDKYHPCDMEQRGFKPDWFRCPEHPSQLLSEFGEFRVQMQEGRDSVNFMEWAMQILHKEDRKI